MQEPSREACRLPDRDSAQAILSGPAFITAALVIEVALDRLGRVEMLGSLESYRWRLVVAMAAAVVVLAGVVAAGVSFAERREPALTVQQFLTKNFRPIF